MKKYKLKKNLSDLKIGVILELKIDDYVYTEYFHKSIVENNPEWFEEIIECKKTDCINKKYKQEYLGDCIRSVNIVKECINNNYKFYYKDIITDQSKKEKKNCIDCEFGNECPDCENYNKWQPKKDNDNIGFLQKGLEEIEKKEENKLEKLKIANNKIQQININRDKIIKIIDKINKIEEKI